MAKFSDTEFKAFAGATAPRAPAAAGGELVDEIGAAAPAVDEAEPAAAGADEAPVPPAAGTPKAKKPAAPKKAAQPPAAAAPVQGSGTAPVRRQAARGGRTAAAGGTAPVAVEAPAASPPAVTAPAAAPSGYAERGAPVAFVPPVAALMPKRLLNTARALGLQWVAINMRAIAVRSEYDTACDEVRTLAAAQGIPPDVVEAALLDMGTAIGAPVAAPLGDEGVAIPADA